MVLGVQMSNVCHRSHCRDFEGSRNWCHCSLLTTGHLPDEFCFNKWFTSHVRYTVAFVSRLFMPDLKRTVKRILPSSAEPSASAPIAETDETSDSDLFPSGEETVDQHDTESEDFQNELRDFIRNLYTPPASEKPVSMLSDLKLKRISKKVTFLCFYIAHMLFFLVVCCQNGFGITEDLVKVIHSNSPVNVLRLTFSHGHSIKVCYSDCALPNKTQNYLVVVKKIEDAIFIGA